MKTKRLFALLVALTLVLGTLSGMTMTAAAAGTYEETDAYVLNFSNQEIEGYEAYDARRLYASDHYAGLYVDEDGDGVNESNWNWTCFSVLNMIHTAKLAEGGEGAYASIPVYCADAVTDGVAGYAYQRVNLEDSGYFSNETAGRLRAVFMNVFPYETDMSKITDAVNAWLSSSGAGYEKLVGLQESEVISAAQAAIWTLTNNVEVYAPYLGTGGYYEESEMVDTTIFRQAATDHTAGNITALYHYLMALAPMAAQSTVVSNGAFGETTVDIAQAEDGTYTATVTTTVTAAVDGADLLTLTAVCGNQASAQQTVADGCNTYTLTITGLAEDTGAITVNIDGQQDGSDVYLFEPKNGRSESQTMYGYIDGATLPVHAEITVNPKDRVLNLHKSTVEGTPLENITFEIYKVGTLEDYLNGKIAIGTVPTEADLAKYAVTENRIASVTTGKDGIASYNFGQVDGIYLVKELTNAVIAAPVEPFFVAVPGGDSENPEYTVNVYPKNTVIDEDVEIEKDVIGIGQQEETLDVDEVHTWIIQTTIPSGMASGQKYEITDVLDWRLTYKGNIRVAVAYDDGSETLPDKTNEAETPAYAEELVLIAGEDYTVTEGKSADDAGHEVDMFVVSLTAAGRKKVAAYVGELYADYEVRVYFDAVINSNAELATEIPNQAKLDYTNNVGKEYEVESDIPFVYTGGLKIMKTDASNTAKLLAGASFKLARRATAEEVAAGLSEKLIVSGEELDVVYVDFFASADMTGEKVTEVTTGENGIALMYGLAYGEYYLVETAAPEGYNKLTAPIAVQISATSHLDDDADTEEVEGSAVIVKNSAKFLLPGTGGAGTTIFTLVGVSIIAVALALVFVLDRRKKA